MVADAYLNLRIKKIIVGNKMNNDLLDWIKKSYGHIQIHKVAIDNDLLKFNLKAEPLIGNPPENYRV